MLMLKCLYERKGREESEITAVFIGDTAQYPGRGLGILKDRIRKDESV